MLNLIVTAIVGVVVSVASVFGVYNYAPLSSLEVLQKSEPQLGSSITVINGSDTLSSSRSVINANFSSLNTDKLQSGDTASTLTITTGTIGTLTLTNFLTAANGGTGTTSPTLNQVMIGNGSSGFKVIGFGTSGQFLTSNGDASAPSWQTAAIDQTANYSWTGVHNFAGSVTYIKALTASSTITFDNGGAPLSYVFPTTRASNGQVLTENGSGALSFATTTNSYSLTDASGLTASGEGGGIAFATSTGMVIPGNTFTASSTISVSGSVSCQETGANGGSCLLYLRSSTGAEFGRCSITTTNSKTVVGSTEIRSFNNSSVSAQKTLCSGVYGTTGGTSLERIADAVSSSINTGVSTTLHVVLEGNSANANANFLLTATK